MVYVDTRRRKQAHTERALEFALSLPITPLLLVIYYPQFGLVAPSFYSIIRGTSLPLSRREADAFNHELKLIYLADNTTEFV